MSEFWRTVLMFLFGAGGLALINLIQERWKVRFQRKADKEDKMDDYKETIIKIKEQINEFISKQNDYNERARAIFKEIETNNVTQNDAMKYVLLDRIICIGQSYIKHGEVTFDERKRLREMYQVYHDGLHGNGDADFIMKAVDALPLKQKI